MFDEADQPILVNLVEKGLNAAIECPIDPPLPDPDRERIQRLMCWLTLWSEIVAEAQELRLTDRPTGLPFGSKLMSISSRYLEHDY